MSRMMPEPELGNIHVSIVKSPGNVKLDAAAVGVKYELLLLNEMAAVPNFFVVVLSFALPNAVKFAASSDESVMVVESFVPSPLSRATTFPKFASLLVVDRK